MSKPIKVQGSPLLLMMGLLAIILLALGLTFLYVPKGRGDGLTRELVIVKGDGSSKVARLLAEEGLIRSRYFFLSYLILTGREKDLKAGRYLLSSKMNMVEIARILTQGLAESDDVEVIIPEGFNVWEIDRKLTEAGLIQARDFFKQAGAREGQLFPDTYRISKHETGNPEKASGPRGFTGIKQDAEGHISELIAKMEENFKRKGGKVDREQLIIASMLEKEVRLSEDMALVAGIIYQRLALGMRLQIDASVAYGACLEEVQNGKGEALYPGGCDVTQVNLMKWIKVDGPYNTYTRLGLPAGPVSNPGERAINAALHPQKSDYLYYLSARDGRTIFSKTAEEHERNRRKYLGI